MVTGPGVPRGTTSAVVAPKGQGAGAAALLAFDTSTEQMAVAACGPCGEVAFDLPGGAAASAQLLAQIEAVLAQAGLTLHDLAAIAFGSGPGAFTGLRTSCAVAQGLGLGLARPLLPLDSLLVVAEDAWAGTFGPGTADAAMPATAGGATRIAVAMDARMDEIYGAVYERHGPGPRDGHMGAGAVADARCIGPWRTVHAPALYTLAAWNDVLDHEADALHALAGSALGAFGERLRQPAGLRTQPAQHHRAAALLRLAQQAFVAGTAVDAAAALPLYLRDKVALTTAERAAVKAAALPAVGHGAEPARMGGKAGSAAAGAP